MKNFSNPLNNIKIASPCSANWNEMYGDDRKRFCAECKLNVYNLSGMTQAEAESLLINSEGRVCVKFYRREDGSVLTKDCPVGWQTIKRRVSRVMTALAIMITTIFSGVLAFKLFNYNSENTYENSIDIIEDSKGAVSFGLYGAMSNLPEIKLEILKNRGGDF
jgi:hypothetical protein